MLKDKFGREHTYLRISLTDKCNMRCSYCMPHEDMQFLPSKALMQTDEIRSIAQTFVEAGIKRIRLTGGEPLVRKDFKDILEALASFPVKLSITTNAYLLDLYIADLVAANIDAVNISLDTLDAARFHSITRRDHLDKVLSNIDFALANGLKVKLNVVIKNGLNEDEIIPMITYGAQKKVAVRFIEFMPFKDNEWAYDAVCSKQDILNAVQNLYTIEEIAVPRSSTSSQFYIPAIQGTFGIISTVTEPFCDGCNRLRLTADGKMKNCLFDNNEMDILQAHRNGEDIKQLLEKSVMKKAASFGGKKPFKSTNASEEYQENRAMIAIGG